MQIWFKCTQCICGITKALFAQSKINWNIYWERCALTAVDRRMHTGLNSMADGEIGRDEWLTEAHTRTNTRARDILVHLWNTDDHNGLLEFRKVLGNHSMCEYVLGRQKPKEFSDAVNAKRTQRSERWTALSNDAIWASHFAPRRRCCTNTCKCVDAHSADMCKYLIICYTISWHYYARIED